MQPNPQQQSAPAPAKTLTQAERNADLLNEMLDRQVEYVPFLAKDPIRLNARLVLQFLCTRTKSGQVCNEQQALRFVMLCKARGLNPWEGDAFLIGFDTQDGPQFSLITAHQAFLKRAEVHPEYDGLQSGVTVRRADATVDIEGDYFEESDALVGGWAKVSFKGRKIPMYKRLRLATFNTGRSRWKLDPGGMIVKCAEADCLRASFPNALGGMYLEGELDREGAVTTPDQAPALLTSPVQHPRRQSEAAQQTPQDQTVQPSARTGPAKEGEPAAGPPNGSKIITAKQHARLRATADDHGWKDPELHALLLHEFGIEHTNQVPMAVYDEVMAKIASGGPIG